MINTREIAHGCSPGDRPGAWHTAPGVPRLDPRLQPPGVHVILACLCETLEAFGALRHRTDLCLEDAWLSRGGTAHRRAPSQGGRAPSDPAPRTDSRSQHKGVTTALGGFASAAGLCTRPGEIAHGGIVDLGDIDGGEITWAGPAGEWHRLPAVEFDTGAGLPRSPGGTTTQPSSPCWVRYRSRQSPQGPASSPTMRGLACDGIVRISGAMAPGRVPMPPRSMTSAP